MKKTVITLALPILLTLTLTGCGDKPDTNPVAPASPSITPSETMTPSMSKTPEPVATSTASGLANTDAAGLESTIKDYNSQVNASNDKAKGIINDYNERIKSATGQ